MEVNMSRGESGTPCDTELTPKQRTMGRIRHLSIMAVLMLGMLNIGHTISFSGVLLPQLLQQRHLTHTEQGLIASIAPLGTAAMSLFCSWLAHWQGRKRTLLMLLTTATAGFVLPVLSQGQTVILVVARALQGMGVLSMAHAMYVAETSSPETRGPILGIASICVYVGAFQVYLMSLFLNWVLLSACLAAFPALALLILALFAPESPSWLLLKGRRQEAEQVTLWLALSDTCTVPVSSDCQRGLRQRLSDELLIKPMLTVTIIMVVMMLSGGYVLPFFMLQFFQKLNANLDPDLPSVLIMALRLVGSIAGVIMMNHFGRRPTLIITSFLSALPILGLALTQLFESALISALPSLQTLIQSYWPIASIALFTLAFSLGLAVIPFTLLGELALPQNAPLTTGMAMAMGYLALFLVIQVYPLAVANFGLGGICIFFGITCLIAAVFVHFALPETRNRRIEDVVNTFRKRSEH